MKRRAPRILLIDDSPESLEAIHASLRELNAELVLARSGREALKLAMNSDELAVVVLDVAMPGMGGFEVAELLRQSPRFFSTPIIFMSGVAMDQHEVFRGYELGAVDYIFKPVDSHVLRSKVGVFVKLRRQAEELERLNESLEQRVQDGARQLQTEELGRRRAEEEQAKLESLLRQAQKLEAVGTLASGVAHDFNNLLMGISGCSTLALTLLEPDHPARAYLTEIRKSTESGTAITRQLLAFSRKRELVEVVFDLNDVIVDAERMLQRLLREDITLVLSLTDSATTIRADPGQIEQILVNLAINAQDAMPGGGCIEIKTELVDLAEHAATARACRPGRYVTFSVSDSGTGIDEATQARVFEPFFTTKEVGKGTGLGLSTVYGIVKQAGGHVELASQIGKGTRFQISLPLSNRAPTPSLPPPPVVYAEAGKTVLLVEDDSLVRMTVRYFLEEGGFRVVEADSGAHALEAWDNVAGSVDVLLTDTVLPGFSGTELIHELTRLDPNLPAILMSAHSAEWLTREGRIRAGTKTLQKPFDKETLLLRLSEVLKEPPAPGPLARDQAFEPLQSRGPTSQVAILVVEDQSAARLAIVEFLRSLGYEVLAAADPKEALDKARERSIGVILTDYRLPGMNGDALAREVKKLWPGAVVLYMSGYGDLKLDPAGPVLKKPVELEVIAASVAGIVGGASKSY